MTGVIHSKFATLLPVLAVLALAACAAPPQGKMGTTGSAEPASFTLPPDSSAPSANAPVTPGPAQPSFTDLSRSPDRFEGLAGVDVIAALGDPSFRRRETPAEVWQYYGPGCILDLFLYDNGPNAADGGKVAHAELRGRLNEPVEAACLSRLVDQHRRQRAG